MERPDDLAGAACWIFDLDNTLYPAACDLFAQIDVRINAYVARRLGLPSDQARRLQKEYFRQYGTTLRGLMLHHDVDAADFLDYVHDIDVTPVPPTPALDAALAALPGRKLIHTNGSVKHAANVLRRLGVVEDRFDGVFDIVAADYVPKPDPIPYATLLRRYGVDPARTVMVEDIARNLAPAAALGMTTVLVDGGEDWGLAPAAADHIHHRVNDLPGWLAGVAGTARP